MKLLRIEISGFGCLADYTLDLENDICQISEENGYGKTTLASFIKVMLYGFDNEKKNKELSERKRFRPRRASEYGGRITFEADGNVYILSKIFGVKAKEDMVSLTNAHTGLRTDIGDEPVGKKFLGIGYESYMKTAFFGQGSLGSSVTSEIQSRTNIEADPTDITAFDKTYEKLLADLRAVSGTGSSTNLKKLSEKLADISIQMKEKEALEKLEIELEGKISNEAKEREKLLSEKRRLSDIRSQYLSANENARKRHILAEKRENMQKREAEYERIKAEFGPDIPTESDILRVYDDVEKLEDEKAKLSQLLSSMPEDDDVMEDPGLRGVIEPAQVVGLIVVLLGVSLMLSGNLHTGLIVVGIGAIAIIYGLVKFNEYRKMAKRYNDKMEKLYDAKSKRKEKLEKSIADYEDSIAVWFESFNVTVNDTPKNCLKKLERQIDAVNRSYLEFEAAIEQYQMYASDIKKLKNSDEDLDISELDTRIREIENKAEEQFKNIMNYQNEHEKVINRLVMLDELENEKTALLQDKQKAEEYAYIAEKTMEHLKAAKENFTAMYTKPIMDSFLKYIEKLLPGYADRFEMDANLRLHIRDGAYSYDIDTLSSGQQDIVNMSLRSALLDIVYEKEKPFIILDDPFVNLDNDNLELAKKWLCLLAESYQVIYLCCNASRKM